MTIYRRRNAGYRGQVLERPAVLGPLLVAGAAALVGYLIVVPALWRFVLGLVFWSVVRALVG